MNFRLPLNSPDLWRRAIAVLAMGLGTAVLVGGWWLDIALLRSLHSGFANMKANTAVALAAAGLALWLLTEGASPMRRRIGRAGAWLTTAIGALTLVQYLLGWDLGIDQLLIADTASGYGLPGRLAPNTALAFVLLGLSLLCLDRQTRRGQRPAEWLSLGAAAIAWLGLLGYLYGTHPLYRFSVHYAMALHTAALLPLLALGVWLVRPRAGMMAVLAGASPGGHLARQLIPVTLISLPLLDVIVGAGVSAGYYDVNLASALHVTFVSLVFLSAIALIARSSHLLSLHHEQVTRQSRLLAAAVEQTADTVMICSREGIIEYVNPAFEQATGYRSDEAVGRRPSLVRSGQHPLSFYKELWGTILNGKSFRTVFVNRRKDGTLYHEQKTITPIKGQSGKISHFVSTGKDISEQTRQEAKLRESEERFRQVAENIREVFWLTTPDKNQMLYVSPGYETVWGRSCESLYAEPRAWLGAIHADDRERVLHAALTDQVPGRYAVEYRIQRPDGAERWIRERAFPIRNTGGDVYRIAGIAEDITERKHAERELIELAHHDPLTGLPNRLLLTDRLRQAMVDAMRHERLVGVALLDLDQFKKINDSFGHATGDALLKQVGGRLRAALRPGDTVAHFGADEFTLVLADMAHVDDATAVLHKIRHAFAAPFLAEGRELYLTASIGITVFPFDDRDDVALLRNADAAMHRAKESGRNTWQFYAAEMTTKVQENLAIENALRGAIERGELTLHYQPQVDLAGGRIAGLEALVRWQHPELGNIGPDRFIPIAEETGLIAPLGAWVLRTACAQAAHWHRAGFPGLRLAVNLSPRQLLQPEFPEIVEQILRDTGLPAALLELELTEGVLLKSSERTVTALDKLHILGVRFAIDDFGTGYSSLAYLRRFPLDVLKIDQVFVRDIATDPDAAAIVRAIIVLARSLGVLVVAEGVETAEQLLFLRAHGCNLLQGYYLSRPKPAETMTELLKDGVVLHA